MANTPSVNIVMVTPQMARKWLQKNRENRKLRDGYVRYLAREIQRGHWKLTTDAIGLRADGGLRNGQHRLMAIVMADIAVPLIVFEGLTEEAFTVLDMGIKRTHGDALGISAMRTADANLIANILEPGIRHRIAVDDITEIDRWWAPVHTTLGSLGLQNQRGLTNAAVRLGVGLRWSMPSVPSRADYVIAQYRALIEGDTTEMTRAVAALWKRLAKESFYGSTELRKAMAVYAWRCFNPDNPDVAPSMTGRDAYLQAFRKSLLELQAKPVTVVDPVGDVEPVVIARRAVGRSRKILNEVAAHV